MGWLCGFLLGVLFCSGTLQSVQRVEFGRLSLPCKPWMQFIWVWIISILVRHFCRLLGLLWSGHTHTSSRLRDNNNTATNTNTTTTVNNKQQVHSHENTTTPATATTGTSATSATTVPSSCVPERTLSRINSRACAVPGSSLFMGLDGHDWHPFEVPTGVYCQGWHASHPVLLPTPPAQGGIEILSKAEAGAPPWFWTSLSSCSSSSSSPSSTRSLRCLRFRSSRVWWFASAFSCATETVRTVQTVQKTWDFTGAVLGDVVDTPDSTTGVMVQTVQRTVWRCRMRRGCGRPCDHAAAVHGFFRTFPRQAEVALRRAC